MRYARGDSSRPGVRYLNHAEEGRSPCEPRARRLADTDDLVQTTLPRALGAVQHFEPRREEAFLSYLPAIGAAIEAYEAALTCLTEDQRQAVVLRIEMGMSFQEVAEATESPSADAARMLVARGLARLSERMVEHRR